MQVSPSCRRFYQTGEILLFHADDNYSVVEQKMCMEISGLCVPTLPTNVCDLLSCPLLVVKKYCVTEDFEIPSAFPCVSDSPGVVCWGRITRLTY